MHRKKEDRADATKLTYELHVHDMAQAHSCGTHKSSEKTYNFIAEVSGSLVIGSD